MTDIASEDGDQIEGAGARNQSDLVRPISAVSTQTRQSTQPPSSRRGLGSPTTTTGSWRTGGVFGGTTASTTTISRPPSANSRASRTHIPSLASHAFFKPMSSQRLQAQRGMRSSPKVTRPTSTADGNSEQGAAGHRQSLISDETAQQGEYSQDGFSHDDKSARPLSQGTEFTEQDDRGMYEPTPTENATVRSAGGSERPLHGSDSLPRPLLLDVGKSKDGSPRSWRGSFRGKDSHGHERLSSSNNSPTFAKKPPDVVPKPGVNYQYFSGNTFFCWGGRLQNTRDRPVNIASAIIVILPAILFLVYS